MGIVQATVAPSARSDRLPGPRGWPRLEWFEIEERFDRAAALALALFYASFGTIGDEWLPFWSWGYPFALLGVAGLAGGLVMYARARARGRPSFGAPALGAISSLAHPWQGGLLLLIVLCAETVLWRRCPPTRRNLVLTVTTALGAAAPLLYYVLLYRFDSVWHSAQQASRHHYSLTALLIPLLPLLAASLPAYLRRPRGFSEIAVRLWPLATLVIYGLSVSGIGGTPLHAFVGITIPLAVLAVEGVQRIGLRRLPGWRVLAVALVGAATIPASVRLVGNAHFYVQPSVANANFIARGDHDALVYLRRDPRPGAVLTRGYLGELVPGATGRKTYVGDCIWSEPDCRSRQGATWDLFEGGLTAQAAQRFVRVTHARFLLKDCRAHADLLESIRPLIVRVKRFGCASVLEVR